MFINFAGAVHLVWEVRMYIFYVFTGHMFLKMQDYLQVPFWAAAEYNAKEMFSAAVIGTEGAKILVDVGGWVSHAASVATGASLASGGGLMPE